MSRPLTIEGHQRLDAVLRRARAALPEPQGHGPCRVAYHQAREDLAFLARMLSDCIDEVNTARAARMAYASELARGTPDEPDPGRIHHSIRRMKDQIAQDQLRLNSRRRTIDILRSMVRELEGRDSLQAWGSSAAMIRNQPRCELVDDVVHAWLEGQPLAQWTLHP